MPAWASKASSLVYVTNRNGNPEIWLHTPGQPDRPVVTARDFPADTTRGLVDPCLSPDATRVIYTRLELAGPGRLWMSAVAGAVLQRTAPKRPRLRTIDRLLWMLLSRVWPNWRRAVQIVTPATVVRWHRRAFAAYWRWNSRPRRVGRPALASGVRALIARCATRTSSGEPHASTASCRRAASTCRRPRGEVPRASRQSPVAIVAKKSIEASWET